MKIEKISLEFKDLEMISEALYRYSKEYEKDYEEGSDECNAAYLCQLDCLWRSFQSIVNQTAHDIEVLM